MNLLDKKRDAYEEGKAAALRGESLTQYRAGYARSVDLWTQFQLGYLDTLRDMRHARAQKEAKHG